MVMDYDSWYVVAEDACRDGWNVLKPTGRQSGARDRQINEWDQVS